MKRIVIWLFTLVSLIACSSNKNNKADKNCTTENGKEELTESDSLVLEAIKWRIKQVDKPQGINHSSHHSHYSHHSHSSHYSSIILQDYETNSR